MCMMYKEEREVADYATVVVRVMMESGNLRGKTSEA